MELKTIIIIAIIHMVSGLISKAIVRGKDYPDYANHGFAWGFFLGVLGLLICVCKSSYKRPSKRTTTKNANTSNNYNTQRNSYSNNPATRAYSNTNNRTVTKQNFTEKLNTLSDAEDVKVQASPEQKKMVSEARNYRAAKKRTYTAIKSNEIISVDLSWSENLAELLEATEVVYTNAELNCNRKLVSEKFNYYINLHYRSFTAADLCHAKRDEIITHLDDLKKIISRLNDRSDFLRVDKATYDQLVSLRSNMYDVTDYLGKRRDMLNKQTGTIRDKVKDECGDRGLRWYRELMERAGK